MSGQGRLQVVLAYLSWFALSPTRRTIICVGPSPKALVAVALSVATALIIAVAFTIVIAVALVIVVVGELRLQS